MNIGKFHSTAFEAKKRTRQYEKSHLVSHKSLRDKPTATVTTLGNDDAQSGSNYMNMELVIVVKGCKDVLTTSRPTGWQFLKIRSDSQMKPLEISKCDITSKKRELTKEWEEDLLIRF